MRFHEGRCPLDDIASVVPLDDAVKQLAERGLTLYLPTYLPHESKLTAVYTVVQDGKIGNFIILVYSNSGDTSISQRSSPSKYCRYLRSRTMSQTLPGTDS